MKTPSLTASPGKAEHRRTLALLGAFCIFLSTIEYLIPKPMPFMRIGIANLPLLLALDILPFTAFLALLGVKVIGQALITGTLFSYILLFSLAGGGISALSMFGLRRLLGRERISLIGISVLGALLSNGAQLALARIFIFGESARYITPPFLAMGIITGLGLGIFCEYFIRRSRWYAEFQTTKVQKSQKGEGEREFLPSSSPSVPSVPLWFLSSLRFRFREKRRGAYEKLFNSGELCLAGLLMMPAMVFNPDPYFRVIQFLFFWFLAWLSGKKNNPLITILIILGIVAFNLTVPYGRVLFSLGPVRITEGALLAGLQRAVTLEGLIMLSRAAIRGDLRLPGPFGELMGESFRILALVQERKHTITRKNFAMDIDNLMFELSETEAPGTSLQNTETAAAGRRGSTTVGRIILAAAVILAWLPWVFTRL
ncbi:Gx transporter family protein [Treponema primitia]|uniref:Gx transporter family protein n=1 Tax=Treponema primitia TaxID=88058 RepID=UPI0002D9FEC9|nr:Gx transporter family protein [Treponema primitia]